AVGFCAHEGDVLQVEPLEEARDDPREPWGREVGVRVERLRMRAERELGDDAAEAVLQQRSDLAPEPSIDEQAVPEDDGRALARLAVVDVPLWELDHAGLLRLRSCVFRNFGQERGLSAAVLTSGVASR